MIIYYGFNQISKDMETSAEEIASYVGRGWHDLIIKMLEELFEAGWNGRMYQIKEKFGSLRCYIAENVIGLNSIVDKYETKSMHICEVCGDKGMIRNGRWLQTLCNKHAQLELDLSD
jgi:hypothetical protein